MANILKAIGEGIWDSIESPYKVVESAVKGDFGEAWENLKAIPGNQERANSEIFNAAGIRGWVGDHPGESVAGVVGTVLAAPYVMAGAQSLGSSVFGQGAAAMPGKGTGSTFGSMDFGGAKPSFSFNGGLPNTSGGGMSGSGVGWQGGSQMGDFIPSTYEGAKEAWGSDLPWGDIIQSGLGALKGMGEEEVKFAKAHRPGFKGIELPATQYDAGGLQNAMAAKEWSTLGQTGPTMGTDINSLLKSFG